jgi:prepilin-type N-terminal cleavage/methylation domain-containing protein
MGQCFDDRSGFTLFEMMVVICVIGILCGVAAPRLAEHYRHVSLQDAAYQICGDLYNIKGLAIHDQSTFSIDFDASANQYKVNTTPDRTVDLNNYRGNVSFTTSNPETASSDIFTSEITFESRGIATSSGQVYLTNQDNIIYRVQTSAAGGVSVKRWNSAGNKWD